MMQRLLGVRSKEPFLLRLMDVNHSCQQSLQSMSPQRNEPSPLLFSIRELANDKAAGGCVLASGEFPISTGC